MRQWLLLVALLSGCAGKRVAVVEPTTPDTSGVIALLGRHAIAHGCPVGPNEALTAAHVIDPRPYDNTVPLKGARWSSGQSTGLIVAEAVIAELDIGLLSSETDFPKHYEVATSGPVPGQKLYLVQFDWRSVDKGFEERVVEVKVTRVVAGHVVFTPSGEPGSSGSCLLNADGKLVGINIAGVGVGYQRREEVGLAVGVWGDLMPPKRKETVVVE